MALDSAGRAQNPGRVTLRNWGATPEEVSAWMPGDDLCPEARFVETRCIDLQSCPAAVFPWLVQMGFGRAGWYSYDLLDNLGRRSSQHIVDKWQRMQAGDTVPGGPISFTAVVVNAPHEFVIALDAKGRLTRRIGFTLSYVLRPTGHGTRLVTRARIKVDLPFGRVLERLILGPGDGLMVRKQLRGIARRTTTV